MIRLPLQTTYNTRDLGGYQSAHGKTQFGRFFRSDSIASLNDVDIESLKAANIKTIVDLRMPSEIARDPNPLKNHPDFHFYAISMLQDQGNQTFALENLPDDFLATLYITILEKSHAEIKALFKVFASHTGGILFHCSAGKDRTGITAMLLLGLMGVQNADIIANYEVTYTYIKQNPKVQSYLEKAPMSLMISKPEFMERTLAHITSNYHSIPSYLEAIGVTSKDLETIIRSFV